MRACVLSHFSHVQFCVTLWTVACQAPLSMGFSRQEYWSRVPWPAGTLAIHRKLISPPKWQWLNYISQCASG